MSRVVLQNVSKWYGLVPAVQNVSLEVEDRELFVLVGPSGCGKTSLLRLIAGLDDVSDGKILIDRRVVNHDAPKSRNIAMVFQNFALYPHMTVFDNMAFGLRMRGYSDEEVSARVRQASDMLELTP
nr:ABC transporter ATP-binding protein [Elusimicrobiota bacterium]